MKSRKEQIAAGRRIVEKYANSKVGKAAAKSHRPQVLERLAELKTEFADFQRRRNEVDARLAALGFGPFRDDVAMMITLCDVIGIDPNAAKVGELYRLTLAWLEREKLRANISAKANSQTNTATNVKPKRNRRTIDHWIDIANKFDNAYPKPTKKAFARTNRLSYDNFMKMYPKAKAEDLKRKRELRVDRNK